MERFSTRGHATSVDEGEHGRAQARPRRSRSCSGVIVSRPGRKGRPLLLPESDEPEPLLLSESDPLDSARPYLLDCD
jgi:hypothetical protein